MAMDAREKKERLVRFLDSRAFDPILKMSPEDFSADQKSKFEDVRRSTEAEQKRFREEYRTAKEVRDNYLSDLNSHTAKKKNEELEALGLPRLPQFKEEFLRLCHELDVK
jgi:ferric-dicitrate binding protein FerR (iron transport regulator)